VKETLKIDNMNTETETKQKIEEAVDAITYEASNLIDGAGTTEGVEKVARKVITELLYGK